MSDTITSTARPQAAPPSVPGPLAAKARKFPCPSCGADVEWNPGAAALRCPYCGAERVVPKSAKEIREHPIDEAIRIPASVGWGIARKTIRCTQCGASTTLDPGIAAGSCAFCGTASVVEAPADEKMVRPEGLLPFRVDRNSVVQKFRQWVRGLWFRPNELKKKSEVTALRGVYVPFWTFDAATHSLWTAEAGQYYYVDVDATDNGQRVMRREQRVRWEPAEGVLEKFFDDVPVPASRGLEADLAKSIEPFPTSDLVEYEPSYLAGFIAEEYAIQADEALKFAKARMEPEIRAACACDIPGDTYRNLEVQTTYSAVSYKNALLPIWIAAYQYAGKPYRFLVNGVTGRVAGKAPYSWVKISLALLAVLAAIVIYSIAER